MSDHERLSRRSFLKTAGVLAGAASLPGAALAEKEVPPADEPVEAAVSVPRRKLGRTGLEISAVSFGTGGGQAPNVLRYGIGKGINFIHTSTGYAGGRAITNVAEAIKNVSKDLVLGLKITWGPENDKAMDEALQTLGVDSVDIAFFTIHNAGDVASDKYRTGAERWKKAGKFKYIGLTTHGQMKECMETALDQGFYDVLMPSFNLGMREDCTPVLERAQKQNVPVLLMKTKHGLDDDGYGKAVPTYLGLPAVGTIIKTLSSFDAIDRMIGDATTKLSARDAADVDRIGRLAMAGHCTMCGVCTTVCPQGIPVADLVRCSDYYLAHSEYYQVAAETYAEVNCGRRAADCADCGLCEQTCRQDVPVRHHLRRADAMLA